MHCLFPGLCASDVFPFPLLVFLSLFPCFPVHLLITSALVPMLSFSCFLLSILTLLPALNLGHLSPCYSSFFAVYLFLFSLLILLLSSSVPVSLITPLPSPSPESCCITLKYPLPLSDVYPCLSSLFCFIILSFCFPSFFYAPLPRNPLIYSLVSFSYFFVYSESPFPLHILSFLH